MRTKTSRNRVLSLVLTVVFVLTFWSVWSSSPAPPSTGSVLQAAGVVSSSFNYQGRLTDTSGNPLDGSYSMRFRIYDQLSGGTLLWDSDAKTVAVSQGLFSIDLSPPQDIFNGQSLYMGTRVQGVDLTPRRQILPAPYALGLRPGATVSGEPTAWDGHVFKVDMQGAYPAASAVLSTVATGSAVQGRSTGGYGVYGYSTNGYGVYGYATGSGTASGYGGYFYSSNGVGAYGESSASRSWADQYAPGVYGKSANGVGVYGVSNSSSGGMAGVLGESTVGYGVEGDSTDSFGVCGFSTENYGGYFHSSNYRGLYASGNSGYYAAFFENPLGNTGAGLYVDGYMWVTGSKTGYVVDCCLNEGPESLETGDVVTIVGAAEPVSGQIPVIRIRKSDSAASKGVAGVVDQPFAMKSGGEGEKALPMPNAAEALASANTAVAPQEYVTVVTLGSFKAIKVDAQYGAIKPGDLLVSSPTPGHAMRADSPAVGTVVGKALGSLESGLGRIPVLVSLK
jgi:hypothetical protein